MGYQYRGTNHDVPANLSLISARPRKSFDPSKCGTKAGFRMHQRYDEPLCDGCRKAQADYMRTYNQARKEMAA